MIYLKGQYYSQIDLIEWFLRGVHELEGSRGTATVELFNPIYDKDKNSLKYKVTPDNLTSIELLAKFREATLIIDTPLYPIYPWDVSIKEGSLFYPLFPNEHEKSESIFTMILDQFFNEKRILNSKYI